MKKSKVTLAIMASLTACMSLTGCNEFVKKDKKGNGYILTLTDSNGTKSNITADEIFGDYYKQVSGAKTMFDSVYELLVRNYWHEDGREAKLEEIQRTATNQVKGVKATAKSNKESNGTTYDDELDELLESYGVEDVDELFNYFEYQSMKSEFEENFYDAKTIGDKSKTNLELLKDGGFFKAIDESTSKKGYLEEKIPYHVKHILVNVSAASGALYNGEITEAEAIKLGRVTELLAKQETGWSFGSIAKALSDDSGSGASYGDLGIMDKDTSYINEFKLGVYAYDSIYNSNTSANQAKIGMPATELDFFANNEDAKIGQIPYAVFEELVKVSDTTKDTNNNKVNNDQAFYYPRNIYFNKYLNNHRISVIVPNDLPLEADLYQPDENGKASGTEAYVGAANSTYAAMKGFKKASECGIDADKVGFINNADGKVLCDDTGKVILVVRGGSSDYQGVHFIVVERSALQETVNNVSLSQYYTTYYPGQKGGEYPVDQSGNDLDTYVNYNNAETKDLKSRAESVESAIKGYDSLLNTYIYEYLVKQQTVTFKEGEGEKVEDAINEYITTQREKASFDKEQTWEQTWLNYMEYIQQQTSERSKDKLLSATCAIQYTNPNKSGKAWEKGGMCGYDSGK